MIEYLFWFSATLVVYGTVGYPALIWVLAKLAPKPVCTGERRCAGQTLTRLHPYSMESIMSAKMTMIYRKGEKLWLGTLKEHPEIMTQGRTLEELEANLKDAYDIMVMEDVPAEHHEKSITVGSGKNLSVNFSGKGASCFGLVPVTMCM